MLFLCRSVSVSVLNVPLTFLSGPRCSDGPVTPIFVNAEQDREESLGWRTSPLANENGRFDTCVASYRNFRRSTFTIALRLLSSVAVAGERNDARNDRPSEVERDAGTMDRGNAESSSARLMTGRKTSSENARPLSAL